MELEYPHPENDPRANAVFILDHNRDDSFTYDRGIGYTLLAICDRLTVLNGTLCELVEALEKR